MIEKWFCLRCDACGEVINYWQEDSVKDAIERERNNDAGAIALRNGKCFCDSDCYEIWTNTRKYKRKNIRNFERK